MNRKSILAQACDAVLTITFASLPVLLCILYFKAFPPAEHELARIAPLLLLSCIPETIWCELCKTFFARTDAEVSLENATRENDFYRGI